MKLSKLYQLAFWASFSGLIVFIVDFGFNNSDAVQEVLNDFYFFVLFLGLVSTLVRYIEKKELFKNKVFIFDFITVAYTFFVFYLYVINLKTDQAHYAFFHTYWVKIAVLFTFIREFSEVNINYKRTFLNPAQLFVASFFIIILLGAIMLMLPNATYQGISFLDALFTSASAVCVTGLIVVDTGSYFTLFGQSIIVLLIQIGGLGILTFASYFSYFFKGGSTFENQLALSDMTSSKKLSEVFSTLKYVLLITFGIEFVASLLIYLSLDSELFTSEFDKIFFSGFHAISAFCNAGFSTLPNSLYELEFRYNYFLHISIMFAFILGGLGFPIVSNLIKFLKYKVLNLFKKKNHQAYRPWVLNINSRITLITTFSITLFAFVLYYFLEYDNTLAEHDGFGKVITALFGVTTPRTAGFNTINEAEQHVFTIALIFFLMWIGASPSSTGGGIKTSTFALAVLNIISLSKGKSRVEVYRREIANVSIRRAFSIMTLSLFVIGLGIMGIAYFDRNQSFINIAFECFSAYSTVGLSLGITGSLSDYSKFIIIIIMFVGRVSTLSILIAIIKKVKHKSYRYPTEEITIN